MSKDKCKMTRKRFEKLMAGRHGVQLREVHDMVSRDMVNPKKRREEAWRTAKHRYARSESEAKQA